MTDKSAEPHNTRSPNIRVTSANWIYRILGSFGATYLSGVTFNLVADFEHTHHLTWEILSRELLLENVLPLVRTQPYVLALVLVLLCAFILTSLVLFPEARRKQDLIQAALDADDKDERKDVQASWTLPNIPLLQKPLIGRSQQVARVVDLLRNDRAVVALYGLPGIGRYSVARAAIEEVVRSGRFTDGTLEVNCSDASTVAAVLKRIIRRFSDGNLIPVNDDLDALQRNVVDVFRERDALVLLRDVPEEVNQAHLLRPLREARATIVMTVSSRPPVTLIPFESSVEIEPLGSTEAVTLLLDLYRRSGRTLSASEIASDAPKIALDLLGGHPKAIELVAEQAAHNRQSIHRAATELEKRMGSGKGIEAVASSLGLSRLVQHVEPHARTLCVALGAFATHDFDRRVVASFAQSLKVSANQAISYLLDHALLHAAVDPREPTAAERLTVHPLIEVSIRAEFSTLPKSDVLKIRRELLAYYARSVEHMSDDERRSELANMQRLLKQSAGQADKVWHKLIVKVCAGLGDIWLDGCSTKEGDVILEVGLDAATWCAPADKKDNTADIRGRAARVYRLAGRALEMRGQLARAAWACEKGRETYADAGDQFEAALLIATVARIKAAQFEQEGGGQCQLTLPPVAEETHDAADRIRGANLSEIKRDIARSACLAEEARCRLLLDEAWIAESLAREAIALMKHHAGCNEASYPHVRGEVAHIAAQIEWHAGKLDDALRHAVDACEAFRSVSDFANEANALCTAGGIAVWQHDLPTAEDFYFVGRRKAEIAGADRVEKEARLWLKLVRWSSGKVEGVDEEQAGAPIMHIYRQASAEKTFEGLREMQQGRLSHAATLFRDALRQAERDNDDDAQCLILHHLAMIMVNQGGHHMGEAVRLLRRSRVLRSRLAG